jgi:ABC-2 type transport system permease protein
VLEYRAQIAIWIQSFIFPLVKMVVWLAVVDEVGPAAGWDEADFISYYLAALVVNYLTSAWILWDWDDDVRTGNLSFKLLKPLDPFHYFLSGEVAWKLFIAVIMVPPIVLLAILSPLVEYPVGPAHFLAAIVAVILGFLVNLFMSCVFAMVALWTTQAANLYGLWAGTGQFLSGFIAPLALFPAAIQRLAAVLPFRSTLGLPIEILLGRLSWAEIGFGFGVTVAWAAAFLALYRLMWRHAARRYEAVGG